MTGANEAAGGKGGESGDQDQVTSGLLGAGTSLGASDTDKCHSPLPVG